MMKLGKCLAVSGMLSLALAGSALANEAFKGPLGVLQNNPGATDGYVLIAPQDSKNTYLIDNQGNVVNEWKSEYVAFYAEMLPNGNMARHSRFADAAPQFGGAAGLIEEFDWSGKKVWEYKMFEPGKLISHHTFEVMPNGNYLILGWEYKSLDEAAAKGLDLKNPDRRLPPEGFKRPDGAIIQGVWPDFIREVDHSGKTVWEWHVWDHIGTGPDQFDINKFCPAAIAPVFAGPDWTHCNGIAYRADTNEICFTSRNLGEVYVLNKGTGKITYRWGNPANYGAGKAPSGYGLDGDQKLFGPHAPDWTPEGNITILDNGNNRPSGNYTRAVELNPKTSEVAWFWAPSSVKANGGNFYSAFQCGAQKLANGNWMITSTNDGHVVEVDAKKQIVWEYLNPVREDAIYKSTDAHGAGGGAIHKAMRYARDWQGFAGKDMKPRYQFPNWIEALAPSPAPAKK